MANIALRKYQQNIEYLIENNEIDQAIENCRKILGVFPKNLKTYQVLSKAFLQNQNFDLAEKVFNTVLHVYPDDFISHIGKSIIAEKNNKLVSAIDHMKYAFENQPANEGLQIELKRLYAINDGVEPNKILFTRGALIKMYLKGNLYDQAIAESRIGLSESPHRIDYQLAMAKSFFLKGDLIQAVEHSIEIVIQLPYCWDANEILNNVITKNHALENNSAYYKRLIEMDPYFEFMLSSTKSIFDVPDIAVLIDEDQMVSDTNSDFASFIDETWNFAGATTSAENNYQNDVDWDSIINKAIESRSSEMVIEAFEPANSIIEQSMIDSGEQMPNSRKNLFLEKLKSTKNPISKLEKQTDWAFNDQGDVVQGSPEVYIKKSTDEVENHTDLNSNMTAEDSSTVGEEGVFDINILPAIDGEDDIDQSTNIWVNDENENPNLNIIGKAPKLADTQPIEIAVESTADLFMDSYKALEGGNTQYALSLLRKLTTDKNNINNVVSHLEEAVINFPENSDLLLFLGEIYTKLDEKEKALAIFQKAQKLISL